MDTSPQTGTEEVQETVLATIDKSMDEQVKVRESIYKGKEYVDIRIFSKAKSGNFLATKKGVTLPKETMIKLQNSMRDLVL